MLDGKKAVHFLVMISGVKVVKNLKGDAQF